MFRGTKASTGALILSLLALAACGPQTVIIPDLSQEAPGLRIGWRFDDLKGAVLAAQANGKPVVMLITAPGVAIGIHLAGVTPLTAHSRLLAAETERYWHQVTPEPLRYVGCRGAEAVAAYAADRPRALPLRSFSVDLIEVMPGDAYGWPQPAEGWSTRLARTGMALVCVDGEMDWLIGATKRAARNPESRRVEIEIGRNFLGISGAPQRDVIFIIPPAR